MTTSGSGYNPSSAPSGGGYHSQYLSGWCVKCGRKRGADGRCADCDGWWTSPLLTVGGPIIGIGTAFLLVALPLLRHETYTPTYAAPVLSSPATPGGMAYRTAPILGTPAAPYAVVSPPRAVAPIAVAGFAPAAATPSVTQNPAAEAERVQQLTRQANALVRADYLRRDARDWNQRHQAAVRTLTPPQSMSAAAPAFPIAPTAPVERPSEMPPPAADFPDTTGADAAAARLL